MVFYVARLPDLLWLLCGNFVFSHCQPGWGTKGSPGITLMMIMITLIIKMIIDGNENHCQNSQRFEFQRRWLQTSFIQRLSSLPKDTDQVIAVTTVINMLRSARRRLEFV